MYVKGGKNLHKETFLNGIFVTFRISEFRPFSVCRDWRQLGFLDQAPDIKLKGNKVLLGVQLPKNSVGTLPKLRSNLLSEERDMIITPMSDAKTALPRIKNWRSSEHLLRLEEYRHWTIRHHQDDTRRRWLLPVTGQAANRPSLANWTKYVQQDELIWAPFATLLVQALQWDS